MPTLPKKRGQCMSVETFLIIYVLLIIIMIGFEIWFLTNNKGVYLRVSYKSLKRIIDSLNNRYKEWGADILSVEISRFYYEYMQEEPQVKKYFQNVVIWIDSVIFRIDSGSKSANCLKDYAIVLKESRDILEKIIHIINAKNINRVFYVILIN